MLCRPLSPILLDILDEQLHLGYFTDLRLNDLVRQLAQGRHLVELRGQQVGQPQRDVRVPGGVSGDLLQLDAVHRNLGLALADQVRRRDLLKPQQV